MPRKSFDLLTGPAYPVPQFSTGAVAEILSLEIWRLQKFLDSPRYQLSPTGRLGKGKGSRRWFTTQDVYRLGIAAFLAKDGFAPKMIAIILQQIEDRDLRDFDGDIEVRKGIALKRTEDEPEFIFFRSGHPPVLKAGSDVYYILDLGEITWDIDRRISSSLTRLGGSKHGSV